MGGTIVLGGVHRFGRSLASAAGTAIPTVDQLVMTNVVDNFYDVFAKRGKMGAVTVQRTALQLPMLLSEAPAGLPSGVGPWGGTERDPARLLMDHADAYLQLPGAQRRPDQGRRPIISHGHLDHYGALPDLARTLRERSNCLDCQGGLCIFF